VSVRWRASLTRARAREISSVFLGRDASGRAVALKKIRIEKEKDGVRARAWPWQPKKAS
jgi:hypothetical protein